MPRCQRTFKSLGEGVVTPGGGGARRWTCPYCPDSEVYETVTDTDLLSYAALALSACERDFGPPHDRSRTALLLLGLRPECVLEPADRRYDLYLQSGSDPFQLRLQIGHEMFHRVCSRGRIFHWTHEMLACLCAVRLLRRCGAEEYAEETVRRYGNAAHELTVTEMMTLDLWAAPAHSAGFYGRAFVTGVELEQAVGWPALCRLARCLDSTGAPDISTWLSLLPANARSDCQRILGITMGNEK